MAAGRPADRRATVLPPEYRPHSTIDLKQDRAVATAIQATSLALVALMVAVALLAGVPSSGWGTGVVVVSTVTACLLYMVLHELTHGVILRTLTGTAPTYAIRLPYLVTGSPAYLSRAAVVAVALGPVVLWGIGLTAALFAVPTDLVLLVYVVLTLNLASSTGDFYQALAALRLPADALVQDSGRQTTVYLPVG